MPPSPRLALSEELSSLMVPELSDQARRAALEKAAEARRVRAELKQQLKDGKVDLAEVLRLAETDETVGKTKVTAVLEAVPAHRQGARAAASWRSSTSRRRGGCAAWAPTSASGSLTPTRTGSTC